MRVAPDKSLKPKAAGLCDGVLGVLAHVEAEGLSERVIEGVPESLATRVAPDKSLKPKAAGLCDEVLAIVSQLEAEGEAEVWYQSRMIRVTEGDQSSASEIQFRATVHEAPTDNIPPLPVDSHEADISPHFAWPPGEGRAVEERLSHSPTMVGKTGFGGAT